MSTFIQRFAFAAPIALALTLVALPAQAYVGPGAGLSLLSALWALVAAIVAALLFIVMWPIRKMMRRKATARDGETAQTPSDQQPH